MLEIEEGGMFDEETMPDWMRSMRGVAHRGSIPPPVQPLAGPPGLLEPPPGTPVGRAPGGQGQDPMDLEEQEVREFDDSRDRGRARDRDRDRRDEDTDRRSGGSVSPSCLLCKNTVYSSSVLCLQHLTAPCCDPFMFKKGGVVQPTIFRSGQHHTVFQVTTKTASSLHLTSPTNFKISRSKHQRIYKLKKQSIAHNERNMGTYHTI